MLNVLLDTNVVLDFCLSREPWFSASRRIFEAVASERLNVVIPATSLKDVFYIASKHVGQKQANAIIDDLLTLAIIGDITADTCMQARLEADEDYEDALIAAVAREQMVDIIVSRDEDAFAHACAPKISPSTFASFFLDADSDALFSEINGEDIRTLS